ncbi:phosphodiester glycosidase family protein [Mucilaginibacter antarcticus]|uniref:Phosphodiester glycosidase family protein n=1 Tax=Mucilaginibacter antarcticus TaxID=1855725 RepID=A0ABW5XT63_9SPHI
MNAKWESKRISRRIILKHYEFKGDLFKSNQNINVIEIKPNRKIKLALGYSAKTLKTVSEFAKEYNAVAAINGGFFDVKNGGSVDLIRVDGIGIAPNLGKGGRVEHQQGALVFNDGKLSIAKWDGAKDWENKLNGDVMVAGPVLAFNSNYNLVDTNSSFVKTRHPRTGVAVTKNRILLITIDGRNDKAAGMGLVEMTKLIKWLKAKDGINLDGGGSTTMWVKGHTDNNVVNYPTDNKKWDHEGARKVANVVLVQKP